MKLKPELSVQLEVVAEACELVALGGYFYYVIQPESDCNFYWHG